MERIFDMVIDWDQQALLYLNQLSSPLLDTIMAAITETYTWIPLYAILLILLYRNFGWQGIYYLLAVVALIILSDQLTSSFMKPYFHRFRPCHDPEIGHLIRIVTRCGGYYGFVSSHAANSFATATFFWLIFRKKYHWMPWLFLWPIVVSYSRMYLGVHYPLDILGGTIVGILLAYLVFKLTKWTAGKVPFALEATKN